MSAANVIGPIVTAFDVERAIVAHLSDVDPDSGGSWYSTGLADVEREMGLPAGQIERPYGFPTATEFHKWPEDQIPCVLVMCAGLAGPPVRRGDGSYEARWMVGISPVVNGVDEDDTRQMALAHAGAARWAMVAKPSLGGFAAGVTWRDETYGDVPAGASRTLGSARVIFEVIVESVVKSRSGPAAPLPDGPPVDPGPWPTVTEVDVIVDPKTIREAVTA